MQRFCYKTYASVKPGNPVLEWKKRMENSHSYRTFGILHELHSTVIFYDTKVTSSINSAS